MGKTFKDNRRQSGTKPPTPVALRQMKHEVRQKRNRRMADLRPIEPENYNKDKDEQATGTP